MAPVRSGFGEKQGAEGTMSNTSVHRPAGVPPLYPQPEKAVNGQGRNDSAPQPPAPGSTMR